MSDPLIVRFSNLLKGSFSFTVLISQTSGPTQDLRLKKEITCFVFMNRLGILYV